MMKGVVIDYTVYFSPNYVASKYAFDTTRKSGELATILKRDVKSVNLVDPKEFNDHTVELINEVHALPYVEAVRTGSPRDLAESQGFEWDPKFPTMVIAHSAGLVAAVSDVLTGPDRVSGSLSSGLHHARRDRGAGFCTFNGLAIGAARARELGAERVLVLDLDAHCGGGTRSLTDPSRVVQIDVSTVNYDRWLPSGNDALFMANPNNYIENVTEALSRADKAGPYNLVLYNAGMDPANSGVSAADLALREQMVAAWANEHSYPVVFALAGGYTVGTLTMDGLIALHKLTVDSFMSAN
jgi:acetoin utilization deacetylase AcuC-like enzyme